ncbi:MAG TPA: ADOP family duplicated permease [Vicinamibacterales bacterium]|nr:ADOP family duplicated permease [Vicinamibacterales bacterium]
MHPPRVAGLVVRAAVPEPHREFLLGDLDEQFEIDARRRGRFKASRQYWMQAFGMIWHGRSLHRRRAASGPAGSGGRFDMGSFWRDVRLGLRTAWHSPGYSAIAILTLALAIGANTLLFSIANPLIIRGLPVKDPATLGWIWENNPASGDVRGAVSIADLLEWRAGTKTFSAIGARDIRDATLTGLGDAQHVQIARSTANLCDIWGLKPVIGRLFQPGEDTPGAPIVAVLSYAYWQKNFQGRDDALGRTFSLDGTPMTIVGVMTPDFDIYAREVDMWVPLPLDATLPRNQRTLRPVGRLAPGATLAAADAEIKAMAAAQAKDHPDTNLNLTPRVVSTHTAITGPDTWVLLGLLAVVVAFVLLIACANLANLVLARIVRHRHDFAVRQALGASRLQLIRPLLTESLLLGLIGGFAGLGLAHAGLRLINATAHDALLQQISIDGNVLIFTAVLSVLTPLLFSLWPALGAGRSGTAETLRDARSTGGRKASRRRNVLVAAQVALALSLLVLSGLVLRTVMNFQHADLGYDTRHELTFRLHPPVNRYPDDASRARFVQELTREVGAIPGATAVGVVSHLPVFDGDIVQTLSGTVHDAPGTDKQPWTTWFATTPDFFKATGIKLLAGRGLETTDLAASEPVAVVNQMAAEEHLGGVTGALGRTIRLKGRGAVDRPVKIVGVVANTRDAQVTRTSPAVFVAFDQWPTEAMTVVVRSDAPAERAADVRAAMRRVDANVAISTPKTITDLVEENTGDNWIINGMFLGFALLALALAAAGLYGVISYSIGQRQREFGVRLALGAAPSTIARMVLVEGFKVTGIGVVLGLVLAVALAQGSASVLYGVSPSDPATFGGVTLLIVLVSLFAVWSPAVRAMRLDPVKTLRAE